MSYREPDRDPHEEAREEALEEVLRELEQPSTFERPEPEPAPGPLTWARVARWTLAIAFVLTTLSRFFSACGP